MKGINCNAYSGTLLSCVETCGPQGDDDKVIELYKRDAPNFSPPFFAVVLTKSSQVLYRSSEIFSAVSFLFIMPPFSCMGVSYDKRMMKKL